MLDLHEEEAMRKLLVLWAALTTLSCSEPQSTDNYINVNVVGLSHSWRTNDGGCQLRNMSSSLACSIAGDLSAEGDDFLLTLNVGFDAELEERTFIDVPEDAYPDVTLRMWVPGSEGATRYKTSDSVREPQTVTLDYFGSGDVEGHFDIGVTTGDADPIRAVGTFEMILIN